MLLLFFDACAHIMDIYWKSSTADVKHPRTEPRPGSRADVAPDLPATKARKPAVQENGNENRGSDKGGGQMICLMLNM